jgi:hypothetical protein
MMIYRIYPEGYDPVVASGLPTEFYRMLGCDWDWNDVEYHRSLESCCVLDEEKPEPRRWYALVEE